MNEQEQRVMAAFVWMNQAIGSKFTRTSDFEGTTVQPSILDGKPAYVITLPGPDKLRFTVVLEGWPNISREEE
jgi:hypothetical protein